MVAPVEVALLVRVAYFFIVEGAFKDNDFVEDRGGASSVAALARMKVGRRPFLLESPRRRPAHHWKTGTLIPLHARRTLADPSPAQLRGKKKKFGPVVVERVAKSLEIYPRHRRRPEDREDSGDEVLELRPASFTGPANWNRNLEPSLEWHTEGPFTRNKSIARRKLFVSGPRRVTLSQRTCQKAGAK